jgi:hypothetical protein
VAESATPNPRPRKARIKKYTPSEKQLAEDETLRDELRQFDLKKFDQAARTGASHDQI